jgi:hypothetical protein
LRAKPCGSWIGLAGDCKPGGKSEGRVEAGNGTVVGAASSGNLLGPPRLRVQDVKMTSVGMAM